MNIEHLKLFVRVAATHNISKAGFELGLSPALASNYLNRLEADLGVRLIHRTTRKVSLTDDGLAFLPHAQDVLFSIEAAAASVGKGGDQIRGTLRITAPASFGRLHIVPGLTEFMNQHPNLAIDLSLNDSVVDLVAGGYDLAIRDATLKDSSLVAKRLAKNQRILCASPYYISKYGLPRTPEELADHHAVVLSGLEQWSFLKDDEEFHIKIAGRLRTDSGDAMRDATVNGLGISQNSLWSVYQHLQRGELVQLLPQYPLVNHSAIWAVFPSSRQLPPRVRAFMDYFTGYFGSPPYWEK